jgi:hypothetical protein
MHVWSKSYGPKIRARLSKVYILSLFALLATLLAGVQTASATDTVFTLSGTFFDSSAVSGTFTINVTTGVVTASSLSYGGQTYTDILTGPLAQGPFTGVTNSGQTPVPVGYAVDTGISSDLPRLDFLIPGTSAVDSLVGYLGGSLCSLNTQCGPDQAGNTWVGAFHAANGSTIMALQSGQLTNAPEPSTLILLSTSLLGLGLWLQSRR